MRSSLIYKLMGAFLLVVVISSLVISVLLVNSTRNAFARYSNRSGQLLASRLGERLSDYFAATGSWEGVGDFLSLEAWAGNLFRAGGHDANGQDDAGERDDRGNEPAPDACRPGWDHRSRFKLAGVGQPPFPPGIERRYPDPGQWVSCGDASGCIRRHRQPGGA